MNVIDSRLELKEEFEELWKLYPRRLGKMQANQSYVKARKRGESYEAIHAGITAYVQHIETNNIEWHFIKHGSTWFSNQCWTDEFK